MGWHRDQHRRGYHHGNLREALIEAALNLIASKGPAGFTFAEAARSAGVSPAAPYRHYKDREALIADVAVKGFDAFTRALRQAWNEGKPDPFVAFHRLGRAYLEFARAEPAFYSAMFEVGLDLGQHAELCKAGDAAFLVVREAVEAMLARAPAGKRPPALMVALHVWAVSHGIATLFGRGDGAGRKQPMSPEELLEAHMLVYLRGLDLIA
jgi:AcrR family transcriptional regulator